MGSRILDVSTADLHRDRTSVKWRAYAPDVLPLFIAEMDAAPCPAVVEATGRALARGDTGYAWSMPYAVALASFAKAQWGWSFDPGTTTRVADVMTGIANLLGLFTDPEGPVVVSSPVYNAFFEVIPATGRQVVDAPLTADGRLDRATLEQAFSGLSAGGHRAVYLLCNPQNPTGTVHRPDELAMLAEVADAHGVQVVSDEIHGPLVYDASTFTPFLTIPGTERGIAVTSASKAWNLAGLKAGVIVPGADAGDAVRRLHPFVTHGSSHLGVIAQTAAYDEGREWLGRLVTELDENRRLLGELVATQLPTVRMLHPEATYLAWLDFRGTPLADDPAGLLLDRARVALSPGPSFGETGEGWARLNFATSPDILREAIRRIASCLG